MKVFLLLILLFIIIEKLLFSKIEGFLDTDYDYFYNGDVLIDKRNKNVAVGIGNNVDSRYIINVGGTLFVKDKLCFGNTCLDARMLKILNDIPSFQPRELCLKTKTGDKVCINEEHLQLLTGQRSLKLKSNIIDNRTNVSRPRYFRRHNYYAHPLNDDNDDYPPPHCGRRGHDHQHNMCSHSIYGYGNFKGYVANPIMDKFDSNKEDRHCFQTHKVKWQEDYPNRDKFVIQANTDSTDRRNWYGKRIYRAFSPKSFNYKCFGNT